MSNRASMSRRDLLKVAAGASGTVVLSSRQVVTAATEPRPRSVIFMVIDGMSAGIAALAEPFSRLLRGRGTHWTTLARQAGTAHGWCDTASLGSLVTDSAAASSAWATGSRVMNGTLNVLPDGRRLTPIGVLARQAGLRVGLVTTTTVTHATPAGFVAVHPDRDSEEEIAGQYLNAADVVLGGGRRFFDGATRADRRDLVSEFGAAGYRFVDSRSRLLTSPSTGRLLGLFDAGHLPYTIDRQRNGDAERVPTLAEMTTVALDALSGLSRGFLLQVEGGRVDHAAHANDAAAALHEMLAFDDALGVALEYARRAPDTLIVVTSDHGNSNPGLNGIGGEYSGSTKSFETLARCQASSGVVLRELHGGRNSKGDVPVDFVDDVIRHLCGIALSAEDAAVLATAVGGPLPYESNRQHASTLGILGGVLGNYTGIGWTGMTHTADMTMVLATGPGQERFSGFRQNTETYSALTTLLGIAHVNPHLSSMAVPRGGVVVPSDEVSHWL